MIWSTFDATSEDSFVAARKQGGDRASLPTTPPRTPGGRARAYDPASMDNFSAEFAAASNTLVKFFASNKAVAEKLGITAPPTIVVVGSQSDGKSSLLNSIASANLGEGDNFNILPENATICTKLPIVCTLFRESGENMATIQGHRGRNGESLEAVVIDGAGLSMEQFGCAIQAKLMDVQLQLLPNTTGAAQIAKPQCERIELTVSGPDMPTLSFVDLPGMRNDDRSMEAQTRQLAQEYFDAENSIVVCVVAGDADMTSKFGNMMFGTLADQGRKPILAHTKVDRLYSAGLSSGTGGGTGDVEHFQRLASLKSNFDTVVREVIDATGESDYFYMAKPSTLDTTACDKLHDTLKSMARDFHPRAIGAEMLCRGLEDRLKRSFDKWLHANLAVQREEMRELKAASGELRPVANAELMNKQVMNMIRGFHCAVATDQADWLDDEQGFRGADFKPAIEHPTNLQVSKQLLDMFREQQEQNYGPALFKRYSAADAEQVSSLLRSGPNAGLQVEHAPGPLADDGSEQERKIRFVDKTAEEAIEDIESRRATLNGDLTDPQIVLIIAKAEVQKLQRAMRRARETEDAEMMARLQTLLIETIESVSHVKFKTEGFKDGLAMSECTGLWAECKPVMLAVIDKEFVRIREERAKLTVNKQMKAKFDEHMCSADGEVLERKTKALISLVNKVVARGPWIGWHTREEAIGELSTESERDVRSMCRKYCKEVNLKRNEHIDALSRPFKLFLQRLEDSSVALTYSSTKEAYVDEETANEITAEANRWYIKCYCEFSLQKMVEASSQEIEKSFLNNDCNSVLSGFSMALEILNHLSGLVETRQFSPRTDIFDDVAEAEKRKELAEQTQFLEESIKQIEAAVRIAH